MNDIGGSWDRRGEFLINYNADTKDLKVPCEITVEADQSHSTPGRARSMNQTEIEKIADVFNSARTSTTESPTRKKENEGILKAQESVKMGVETTFTHKGITYKITPLKIGDKNLDDKAKEIVQKKVEALKAIAKFRGEKIHFLTANPVTASSKRIEATAILSRSTTSPIAKASPSTSPKSTSSVLLSNVSKRLPLVGWVKLDRYLGFRDGRQIENNFFEVKVNNTIITDTKELELVEKELSNIANSTNQSTKALSEAMRQGKGVEIPIGNKIYQFVHVNHSDHEKTPEKESQKIFDLKASRQDWLQKQPIEARLPLSVQQFLQTSNPQTSSDVTNVTLTKKPEPPPRPPLPPVTKNTELGQSVARVSSQILPRGTVARRPAPPIPPQDTVGRKGAQALPPLPTPPASRRNSLTRSVASSPSATPSPTVAPRPDLWNDKKTNALMEKFLLISIEYQQPVFNKDDVDAILKNHYDNLPKEQRALFDESLSKKEVIKFGDYSLIPRK